LAVTKISDFFQFLFLSKKKIKGTTHTCCKQFQQSIWFFSVARIRRVGNQPLKLPELRTLLAVGDGDCTRYVGGKDLSSGYRLWPWLLVS
jgi:hypothetical protein